MIKRELSIFLIVGLLTVAIDFIIYRGITYTNFLDIKSIDVAKGLGFISGTIFAYFANSFWTFNQKATDPSSFGRFILVYLIGLGANVLVNYLSISLLASIVLFHEYNLYIAFILATGVSATLNFIGMKFFVFTYNK